MACYTYGVSANMKEERQMQGSRRKHTILRIAKENGNIFFLNNIN
jgi:hypothetical protein